MLCYNYYHLFLIVVKNIVCKDRKIIKKYQVILTLSRIIVATLLILYSLNDLKHLNMMKCDVLYTKAVMGVK